MYENVQDWYTTVTQSQMRKRAAGAAHCRPKELVRGLELTAVCCVSLYQEAGGAVMEG